MKLHLFGHHRLASLAVALLMVVSFMPVNIFASVNSNETVVAIASPEQTYYIANNGQSLTEIGVPTTLKATITTPSTTVGGTATTRQENIEINWVGTYDPNTSGTYILNCRLKDTSIKTSLGSLPRIYVVVSSNRYLVTGNDPQQGLLITDTQEQQTFYSYCVDHLKTWVETDKSDIYDNIGIDGDIDAKKVELARVLYAGYPNDALGLSALYNASNPKSYGEETQKVVWAIVKPNDDDLPNDGTGTGLTAKYNYAKNAVNSGTDAAALYKYALYEYATNGGVITETDLKQYLSNVTDAVVTSDLTSKDLLMNSKSKTVTFTLKANRNTIVKVTNIPWGTTLKNSSGTVLSTGWSVNVPGGSTGTTLTLTRTASTDITGELSFSYVSSRAVYGTDNLTLFSPSSVGYQRMLGYLMSTKTDKLVLNYVHGSVGSLSVSKEVTGTAGSTAKEFSFTVTLDDKTVTGIFDDMVFDKGVATFTLKDGETKTATGLPYTGYTVTEASDIQYVTTSKNETGTISATASVCTFTNEKADTSTHAYGKVAITKHAESDTGPVLADAHYQIYKEENGSKLYYIAPEQSGNTATWTADSTKATTLVTDKNGNAYAEGLEAGYYSLIEVEPAPEGYLISNTPVEFSMRQALAENEQSDPVGITLSDALAPKKVGSLSVTKEVAGNAADKNLEFFFMVTLADTSVTGKYGEMEFDNGVANFTLQHGKTITATDLPYTSYKVEEAKDIEYITTSKNATGTINAVTSECTFTNTKNDTSKIAYGKVSITKRGVSDAGPLLAQAHYKIYQTVNGKKLYYVAPVETDATASWTSDIAQATLLTTNSNGVASADGLEAGYYALLEVNPAPRGYAIDDTPVTFTITQELAEIHGSLTVYTKQFDVVSPNTGDQDETTTSPDTGDHTNLPLWFASFVFASIAAAGCGWMVIRHRRA